MRRFILSFCCLALYAGTASAGEFRRAPANGVLNEYIVVLEDGVAQRGRPADRPDIPEPDLAGPRVSEVVDELRHLYGGEILRTWEHALQGYLVRLPESAARALARDPKVKSVEQNSILSAPIADCYETTIDPSTVRAFPTSPQSINCADPDPQNSVATCIDNWGLDRIDQSSVWRDGLYHFGPKGRAVNVFIIDTGIRATHEEFKDANGASRIGTGYNAATPGGSLNDLVGHGTHVAGIVAGKTFGVAKHAILRPVKVRSDASGLISRDAVIAGLNWIASVSTGASVATMSLNASDMPTSTDVHTAVRNMMGWGVQLIQAAGNLNQDACTWTLGSPGAVPETLVVAGSDENDQRWRRRSGDPLYDFYVGYPNYDVSSNYGSCLDLWAPAAHIVSASNEGDNSYCRLSGTSMAAPHTAGMAALYLGKNGTASTEKVRDRLVNYALSGVLDGSSSSDGFIQPGSPNRLLSTNSVTSWIDAVACFTASCNASTRTCTFNASCSVVDPDTYIYKYWWDFGEGTRYQGSSTVTHTFPANATYQVGLGLFVWSGETPSTSKCVNFTGSAVPGCIDVIAAPRDAQVLSQNVPATMVALRNYTVSATLKNVGTQAWSPVGPSPQCDVFRLGSTTPQDNLTWGRMRADLPTTVAPDGQVTITFPVAAPATPGTYNFQWRMLQECVTWFGDSTQNVPVNVQLAPSRGAQVLSQSVPTTMAAGRVYPVSVTLKNVGTETWSPIGPQCNAYRLGAANPYNNGTWLPATRVELPAPVAPGGQVTLNFKVTAPFTPGTYNFQWQMVQECVTWFGDLTPNVAVNVQPAPIRDAQILSQTVPPSMVAGQSYPVSIRVKNVGTQTWSPIGPQCNAYRFGSANPYNNGTWLPATRVELPASVAPGGEVTLNFTVTAPSTPGTYNFQWQMVQECVTWFGDFTPNIEMTVTP